VLVLYSTKQGRSLAKWAAGSCYFNNLKLLGVVFPSQVVSFLSRRGRIYLFRDVINVTYVETGSRKTIANLQYFGV